MCLLECVFGEIDLKNRMKLLFNPPDLITDQMLNWGEMIVRLHVILITHY